MRENKSNRGKLIVVVGGCFGSEGKGRHVEVITRNKLHGQIHAAVRTGAPNAGHTIYHNGKKFAMQQIPCSWIDPDCDLFLGAGSQIDVEILMREMDWVEENSTRHRPLYIDRNAIIQDHSCMEKEKELKMHADIGSTAEGCGVALQRRIARDGSISTIGEFYGTGNKSSNNRYPDLMRAIDNGSIKLVDVSYELNGLYDCGKAILLEGTQGAGLSMYHCPDYPRCTSRDTNAANWLAEAGLSPNCNMEIHMVMRTFPIRVAGKSGYMPEEISWGHLLRRTSADVSEESIVNLEEETEKAITLAETDNIIWNDVVSTALREMKPEYREEVEPFIEITTVTKKARRIALFDSDFYQKYLEINRPDVVVLQFADYLDREACESLRADFEDVRILKREDVVRGIGAGTEVMMNQYARLGYPVDYTGIGKHHTIKITD